MRARVCLPFRNSGAVERLRHNVNSLGYSFKLCDDVISVFKGSILCCKVVQDAFKGVCIVYAGEGLKTLNTGKSPKMLEKVRQFREEYQENGN